MLNFAEELLLLILDDKKATFRPLPEHIVRAALAGSLLMELALANRIDTDLHVLMVINPEPVGDPLMDDILERLQTDSTKRTASQWLNEIAWQMEKLRQQVLQQLVNKGVLKIEERKILWVYAQRRYPLLDNREIKEVRTRLRELIFSKGIPDPREAVLIGLVHACGIVDALFDEYEMGQVMPRLVELSRLDLIGRAVDQSIRELFDAMIPLNLVP